MLLVFGFWSLSLSLLRRRGCVNDVVNIKKFFRTHYTLNDTLVLTDDKRAEPETDHAPTRKNILNAFKWLVKGAKPGDSLLLHYSGHGGKSKNHDGTEGTWLQKTLRRGTARV